MDNLFTNNISISQYFGQFPLFYWPSTLNFPNEEFLIQETQKLSNTNLKIEADLDEAFPQTFSNSKLPKQIKIKKRKLHKKKNSKSTKVNEFLKKIKDKNFSGKHQKTGRNMPSIIFRLFIIYVLKDANLQNLYQPLSLRYNLSNSHIQFLQKFKQYFPQQRKYIRRSLIQSISFGHIQQKEFCLVFRILLKNYLKTAIFSTIYCSLKLSRKNKVKQAKFVKEVYKMIFCSNQMKKSSFSNISGGN